MTAKDALDARVDALMANELSRYQSALDAVGLESGRDVSLQSALDRLRSERADDGALAAAPRLPALEGAPEERAPEPARKTPGDRCPVVDAVVPAAIEAGLPSGAAEVTTQPGSEQAASSSSTPSPSGARSESSRRRPSRAPIIDVDDLQGVRVEWADG